MIIAIPDMRSDSYTVSYVHSRKIFNNYTYSRKIFKITYIIDFSILHNIKAIQT